MYYYEFDRVVGRTAESLLRARRRISPLVVLQRRQPASTNKDGVEILLGKSMACCSSESLDLCRSIGCISRPRPPGSKGGRGTSPGIRGAVRRSVRGREGATIDEPDDMVVLCEHMLTCFHNLYQVCVMMMLPLPSGSLNEDVAPSERKSLRARLAAMSRKERPEGCFRFRLSTRSTRPCDTSCSVAEGPTLLRYAAD